MAQDQVVTAVPLQNRPGAREVAVAIGVAGAFAAGYVLLARAHGALGIARNDDWAYYKVAFAFSRTGHLRLVDWGQMSLVGQILLVAPVLAVVGRSMAGLQVTVAVLGAAAVVFSYLLLRTFLPVRWAALGAALVLVGPLMGVLSVSFMTDVPAYFAEALTLLVGWRALSRPKISLGWLAASAVVGLVAVSIRDNGAVAFGAVLVIALARSWSAGDRRNLRAVLGLVVGFAVVGLALLGWAHGLPHAEPTTLDLHTAVARKVPRAILTLAFFISPCVLAVSPRRLLAAVRRTDRWLQVLAGLVTLGLIGASTADFLGNVFTTTASAQPPHEPLGVPTPEFIPHVLYLALRLAAVCALVMIMGVVLVASQAALTYWRGHGGRGLVDGLAAPTSAVALLTVYLLASGLVQGLSMAVLDVPLFDRYLLGLVPFAAGLLLAFTEARGLGVRGSGRGLVLVGVVGLALVGLLAVDASATADGAKWRLAEKAQALGYAPATIDGGFEWFGAHQPDVVEHPFAVGTATVPWWIRLYTPRPVCVTDGAVADRGPTASQPILATQRATTLFGQHVVYVARPGPDRCQPTGR